MTLAYKRHPLSAAFPDIPDDEFEELVEDIAAHDLKHKIVLYQGQVLDGWHRYRGCVEAIKRGAKVSIRLDTYSGSDPVGLVKSENLMRRHLSGSQRANAVVTLNEWRPGGRPEKNPAPGAELPPKTTEQMAAEAGVGTRTIEQAKVVHAHGSAALREAVKEGDVSLKKAAGIAKLPKAEQRQAMRAPAAPKPAVKAPTELEAKFEKLQAAYEELREKWQVLADERKTYEAFRDGKEVEEMAKLRFELQQVIRRRDELMEENDQKQRQINHWKRKAGVTA